MFTNINALFHLTWKREDYIQALNESTQLAAPILKTSLLATAVLNISNMKMLSPITQLLVSLLMVVFAEM